MNAYHLNTDESLLVKRCLGGDRTAQKALYQKYARAMYTTIVRMVADKEDAEDLLQETFVKVFTKLHTFKGESTLGAWIKRIAVNAGLNFIRSKKQLYFATLEDNLTPTVPPVNMESNDDTDLKKIHEAIKALPEGSRVVFTLFLLEGYQHKEIARILNISESTSKSQYQRARKLLQEKLNSLASIAR